MSILISTFPISITDTDAKDTSDAKNRIMDSSEASLLGSLKEINIAIGQDQLA